MEQKVHDLGGHIHRTKGMSKSQEDKLMKSWERELKSYAEEFLSENYPEVNKDIPVKTNGRLKRALGRYIRLYVNPRNITDKYKIIDNTIPKKIDVSKDLIRFYPEHTIYSVMRHELIHYALHQMGQPFADGHPHFENELKKHNASSTRTIHFKGLQTEHIFKCNDCESVLKTKNNQVKKHPENYSCGNCKGGIEYVKTEEKYY